MSGQRVGTIVKCVREWLDVNEFSLDARRATWTAVETPMRNEARNVQDELVRFQMRWLLGWHWWLVHQCPSTGPLGRRTVGQAPTAPRSRRNTSPPEPS